MISVSERYALASEAADRAERAANYAATCVPEAVKRGDGGNPDSPASPMNQAARWAAEARRAVEFIADTVGESGEAWERASRELARANKAFEETRFTQHKGDRYEAYGKASTAAHEEWLRKNPDSISAQHEEAARQHPEIMGAPEPQTPYEHGPKPASTDEKRLVWLRLLFLLRQHGDDIQAAVNAGVIPQDIDREARAIFLAGNLEPFNEPVPF